MLADPLQSDKPCYHRMEKMLVHYYYIRSLEGLLYYCKYPRCLNIGLHQDKSTQAVLKQFGSICLHHKRRNQVYSRYIHRLVEWL